VHAEDVTNLVKNVAKQIVAKNDNLFASAANDGSFAVAAVAA